MGEGGAGDSDRCGRWSGIGRGTLSRQLIKEWECMGW